MDRFIEIALTKRDVSCRVKLLDDLAPKTCEIVWNALPFEGDAFHGKYARNEVYTFVPAPGENPGRENSTITPIPGDVTAFWFDRSIIATKSHGYSADSDPYAHDEVVDLAVFYERNNLLLNPDYGFVPGNVFGTVVEGLERFADACQDLWRAGALGESFAYRRL
ncbi:MAG TPA: DUF3830 family protein [Streptosporangiaceae bacterium]